MWFPSARKAQNHRDKAQVSLYKDNQPDATSCNAVSKVIPGFWSGVLLWNVRLVPFSGKKNALTEETKEGSGARDKNAGTTDEGNASKAESKGSR